MSDNAFCNVDEKRLIADIAVATTKVVFVAPGLNEPVADALSSAWYRLGGSNVIVVLDVDPEVCRLGYGTLEGLEIVQQAALKAGQTVGHQPGVRICLLMTDDATTVFSPTPLLIEAGSGKRENPNAIRIGAASVQVQKELGITGEREKTRTIGLDPVPLKRIEEVKNDLESNPPVKFDIARKVHVFNSQLEFVDFKLEGCFVSRKTASLSPDLMGLAEDEATKKRLHGSFRVLQENDIVDEESQLSEKTLSEERKRIADTYITPLKDFGPVLLRSNKDDFENEVKELRQLVEKFQKKLRFKLDGIMKKNAKRLADALFSSVKAHRPARWTRFLGPNPTDEDIKNQLILDIRDAFGDVKQLTKAMKVTTLFKGVTYETLTDPEFIEKAQAKFPSLRLHDEYNAARESNTDSVN